VKKQRRYSCSNVADENKLRAAD